MSLTVALDARLAGQTMTGDTSYWRGLVRGLASLDTDDRFLLLSNTARPPGIPETANVRWIRTGPSGSRLWSLVHFPLQARKLGAQVSHTQYTLSPLVGRHGVTTIHDVSFLINPAWFRPRDRLLLRTQVPASARRAARVLTVSETSKAEIAQLIPGLGDKVRVTPNALGDNICPMPPEQAESAVRRLGVERPYLLTVGTRWPRKNMSLAIDAARLADRRIVVTGKAGWGTEAPGACFTGYVEDAGLTALYQCADLYLAPSFHEGFGIPLLEAFACECPVLCSSGGALPEVGADAVEVATSFEPADWAAKITEMLANSSKLSLMRERGLARLKDFDWGRTARLTLEAYREAAL